jgi:hypothetical protein
MKMPRPLMPLFPAFGMMAAFEALPFLVRSSAVDSGISALCFPARLVTILVLPDAALTKSGSPVVIVGTAFIIALLQWYLIFAGGIWLFRRLKKRKETS